MNLIPVELIERKLFGEPPNLGIFRFKVPEGTYENGFIAGQAAGLTVNARSWTRGATKPRMYSIASTSYDLVERGEIELFIKKVNEGGEREDGRGLVTAPLFEIPGEDVRNPKEISFHMLPKITGRLYLDENKHRHVTSVVVGTGVAPILSRYRTFVETARRDGNVYNKVLQREILIYGTARCGDLVPYQNLLIEFQINDGLTFLAAQSKIRCNPDNMDYVGDWFMNRSPELIGKGVRITMEDIKEGDFKDESRLEKQILKRRFSKDKDVFLLCGPPEVTGRDGKVAAMLTARGIPKENIKVEEYWKKLKTRFVT